VAGTPLKPPPRIKPPPGNSQLRRRYRAHSTRRDNHRIHVPVHAGDARRIVAKALRQPGEYFGCFNHVRVRRNQQSGIYRSR
jgi:hypothetical protein